MEEQPVPVKPKASALAKTDVPNTPDINQAAAVAMAATEALGPDGKDLAKMTAA